MNVRDLPPCIFLNQHVPADRMRFSLAHELGHIIMHTVPGDEIENEANAFAAELLVPEKQFRRALTGQRLSLEWLARQRCILEGLDGILIVPGRSYRRGDTSPDRISLEETVRTWLAHP